MLFGSLSVIAFLVLYFICFLLLFHSFQCITHVNHCCFNSLTLCVCAVHCNASVLCILLFGRFPFSVIKGENARVFTGCRVQIFRIAVVIISWELRSLLILSRPLRRRQVCSAGRSCDLPWRRVRNDVWLMLGRRARNHCVRARGEHWIGLGFDLQFWFGCGHQSNARYRWATRHEQVLQNGMHPVALNLWIWSSRLH